MKSPKQGCPDDQSDDGQELDEGNDHDEAGDRVLSADVLIVASDELLFQLAEESDDAAKEGSDQEWER